LLQNGDAEIVAALCECDAAVVDCWNVNADTPLIWACIEGRAEAVKVLLKHGADVNMLNQYGASTLLCAVMIGEDPEQDAKSDKRRAEILTMLLEKNGKLVNFQDREGSSAMHLAASCGYLECVKTLLKFGADITLRNAIGQTPLEEAQDSELRESGPCVEHLRVMWRQLEEEAAARMMAMLEMEEEADKNATGMTGAGTGTNSKKNKKKNKKAKRKAAAKLQQQQQQEDVNHVVNEPAELEENDAIIEKPAEPEPAGEEPSAEPTTATTTSHDAKDDEASEASSDEDDDALLRDSIVSISQEHSDEEVEERTVESEATSVEDLSSVPAADATPTAGAWTTVGKKHRSAVSAATATSVESSSSPKNEKAALSTPARRKSAATSPPKSAPHTPRRNLNQHSSHVRARSSAGGRTSHTSGASAPSSVVKDGAFAHSSNRPHEERWEKSSGFVTSGRASRSFASSSQLNPNALTFRSLGVSSGSSNSPSVSSAAAISSSGQPLTASSPWRPGFGSSGTAPYTVASSSLSSTGLHYSSAGRLTWKQQRASGNHQVAREARDRWVSKLRLSNENVAETLGYLACGLCGELVDDNLQCNGGRSDDKNASTCTQLYCASCLQSSAFCPAESTMFKCVRCHQVVAKNSMTRNSLAQAQAASLGLSTSSSTGAGAKDDSVCYSLENMQHILEASDSRAFAVDLRAFHLAPGTDLSSLSNGQLEVLESAHQLALTQIVEQRLANARALERLQMEEWLKMQRDVLQFAPR
jgi:hypothetical protein